MKVVDSSFFIALFRRDDGHHQRSLEIYDELKENKETMIATTHVLEETVTYIFKKDGSESAYTTIEFLLESDGLKIDTVNLDDIRLSAEILKKYKRLSLSDALSVQLARKYEIKDIVSFDSDFDHIERIQRIY